MGDPRRGLAKNARTYSTTVIEKAVRAGKRLRRRGVVHAAWGLMERGGKLVGEPGLIMFVSTKRAKKKLAAARLLPKALVVAVGNREVEVPVDVQQVPRGKKHLSQAAAGDRARVSSRKERATLSAFFDGPKGVAAVISGHVAAVGDNFTVTAANGNEVELGVVTVSIENTTDDAARIDGVDPSLEPSLTLVDSGLRDVTDHDVGVVLTLRLTSGDRKAAIAGVNMPANFGGPDMVGLIALQGRVTNPGDSGAPALDFKGQLVGFVVGSAGNRTHLIPARRVFDAIS